MRRAFVLCNVLSEQDVEWIISKEFVMEDVRNRAKSSTSLLVKTVIRQFAGCRIESLVVTQVFDAVWESSGHPTSDLSRVENGRDDSSCAVIENRVTGGIA